MRGHLPALLRWRLPAAGPSRHLGQQPDCLPNATAFGAQSLQPSRVNNITRRATWLAPVLLLGLTAVPVAAGFARLLWLVTGEMRPDTARFSAGPAPLVIHILSVTMFGVLGALQFASGIRSRWPRWHQSAGKAVAPSGLVAAFTGLWMTLFYPAGDYDGPLVFIMRLLFGSAMAGSLLLGLDAVRRRDFFGHGAWMIRGYAIGMGAGTQVITTAPWLLLVGPTEELSRALLMGTGWVINLAVAEWIIHRRRSRLN